MSGVRPGAALRPTVLDHLRGAVALALPLVLIACSGDAPATTPTPTGPATSAAPPDARDQLAAFAAAAQDRHLVASYTLSVAGRSDRTVVVTSAPDRSWRVDVPGGALGGTADVSVVRTAAGMFQCTLPSAGLPADCVRVGGPDADLPGSVDPRVQHPFTDWLAVLTDRQAALSVSTAAPLPGAGGTCFAVESTAVSLNPPLDVGIYCYDVDGTLTGARLPFGTLVLAGAPAAPPETVTLPGPVVEREPLRMAAPPPVDPSESPSV
nr:hypothetical protein [Micromonospora sp. DSM 115978]